MMLSGFLFLLLVPGGSSSDPTSFPGGGSSSDYSELLDSDYETYPTVAAGGSSSDYSELLDSDYETYPTVAAGFPGLPGPLKPNPNSGSVEPIKENPNDQNVRRPPRYPFCTHKSVLDYLKYPLNVDQSSKTWPGRAEEPLNVTLDVLLYAILDVNEKEQTFVSHVWIDMSWYLDLSWNPDKFCGIKTIYLPISEWWIPDVTIEEQMEKDKVVPSPYLTIRNNGFVFTRNTMTVVSTCKMQIYKFPFDVQSCHFSFKSAVLQADDLQLDQADKPHWNMKWSRKMLIDGEWQLLDMTIDKKTVDNFGVNQSMLVYTIIMKRHSALYGVTFLLPILFFLVLDLASFLISDSSGEKLGFKVTVLLAVTVMQLILIEILPSSSDRIPLIVAYCIGSFGLMMCSLLETIFVMYLMEKDCTSQDNKGSSSQMTEESHDFKLSDELNGEMKTLTVLHGTSKEEMKPGYWTMVAKNINKTFFLLYFTVVSLFLCYLFIIWTGEK